MTESTDFIDVLQEFTLQHSLKVEAVSNRILANDYIDFAKASGVHCLIHPNEQYCQNPGSVIPDTTPFTNNPTPELIIRTAAYMEGSQAAEGDYRFNGPLTDGYEQHEMRAQLIKTEMPNKFYLFVATPVFTLYDARTFPEREDWFDEFFKDMDWAVTRIAAGDVATGSIWDDLTDADLESRGIRRYYQMVANSIDEMKERQSSLELSLLSAQETALQYASQVANVRAQIASFNPDIGRTDLTTIRHPDILSIISKKDNSGTWYVEVITKPLFMTPNANPENLPIPEGGIPIGQVEARLYLHNGSSNPFQFLAHGKKTIGRQRRNVVHPHVLSGNRPCLGSYGDTIIDAVSNGDMETLIDVMFIYLQSANTEDSAGKTWPQWLGREFDSVGSNEHRPDPVPEVPEYIDQPAEVA